MLTFIILFAWFAVVGYAGYVFGRERECQRWVDAFTDTVDAGQAYWDELERRINQ